MSYSFFKYLLFCTGCIGFEKDLSIVEKQKEIIPALIYIKAKDFPFGIIDEKDEIRYRGTTILVRIESIAGYPFPARIEKIQNKGDLITISFLDIMGYSKAVVLEPFNEIKIESIRDRSPVAAALRESEKIFALKQRIASADNRKEEEAKQKAASLKRLMKDLSKFGVRCKLIEQKLVFLDGMYAVTYIRDENRFEILITRTDDFVADFADDEIGWRRMIKKIRKLDSEFDPEEHLDEYLDG